MDAAGGLVVGCTLCNNNVNRGESWDHENVPV